MPQTIARYLVEEELGRGGFGVVYLAYDTELDRKVAIKLSRHETSSGITPDRELHALARLDHPGIIPIYDTGHYEGRPYFVSKYIGGPTLSKCLRSRTFTPHEAAELVAQICDAVSHAHSRGIILRDIKPSNIILEHGVRPVLIDFGIALFEEDFGIDPLRSAGTLAYMCPEQANGRGHLLDARSDVYSLGAILYELLSGRIPFEGNTQTTVTKIRQDEPARPSLREGDVPDKLELICTKALSKSPSGRHESAAELATALREPGLGLLPAPTPARTGLTPRGLRSFDGDDAEVFLSLLPGPLAASGLPESVDFWTSRIGSQIKFDVTQQRFAIGVIHGLSGSGKSSLLRAGIIPRLHPSVIPIFIEAASGPIEQRLLSSLRNIHPEIDAAADLPAAIRSIKEQDGGQTILLAIDQFEQWLRDWDRGHGNELVRALRACDGIHVQCIIVVRDDFWTGICQFMEAIGFELHQNHNTRAVELFETSHAKQILTTFGKALGALADPPDEKQQAFVDGAIASLAEKSEGKTSPVQIALLAEVFRNRPWELAELKKIGGARAIGSLFLDQSFLHRSAPTRNRFHADAAAKVLEFLLPSTDLNIRAAAKPISEIREASGYGNHSQAFSNLVQILDTELRLITPVESPDPGDEIPQYQVTHDYLVPSIREWLDSQRSDSARGRAQLRLERLAASFEQDHDRRHLPNLLEYFRFCALTKPRRRSDQEQNLMRHARRRTLAISALAAVALAVLAIVGLQYRDRLRFDDWLADLRGAHTEDIAPLLTDQFPTRKLEESQLRQYFENSTPGSAQRFNLGLGLIRLEPSDELGQELFHHLLRTRPSEFAAACPILRAHDPKFESRILQPAKSPALLMAIVTSDRVASIEIAITRPAIEQFLDEDADEIAKWLRVTTASKALLRLLEEFETPLPIEPDAEAPPFDPASERRLAMSTLSRHLLGQNSAIYDLLDLQGIPVRQAYLIDGILPSIIPQDELLGHLASKPPTRVGAAILLALQAYAPDGQAPPSDLMRVAEDTCASTGDAYLDSAARLLFRHWGITAPEVRRELPKDGETHNWFNAEDGTKMVIIQTQANDAEIPHNFAISASPLRYDRFKKLVPIQEGVLGHEHEGFPVHGMDLFDAMRYCNALSKDARLDPCYLPSPVRPGFLEPAPDYLNKSGYRVPTFAEMELASRGTHIVCTVPAELADLVDRYEWTRRNSGRKFHLPGSLRPNEFGLSDTLSNFSEWLFKPTEIPDGLNDEDRRMQVQRNSAMRNSYFDTPAELIEVGHVFPQIPQNMLPSTSFRLVRSLPKQAHSGE